jgi:L-arabinokinase
MGELMFQSHWSYTECGLGCDETDQLIEFVRRNRGDDALFGAKITGGGAGGTVAVLGSQDGAEAFQKVIDDYTKLRGVAPYVMEGSSIGADRFGIQVIRENS